MKTKNYIQAPLPFQGQKRRFLKLFKNALKEFPANTVFVDLFGGSGLLSHTVKEVHPTARVIYNDFDNYAERLANIGKTNEIIKDIRLLLAKVECKKRVPNALRNQVLERIKSEKGYIDYLTLSSNLLFSGKYASSFEELQGHAFYNRINQSDYTAKGYLQGVERVCMDYLKLHQQFKNIPNVVFLIDPPYLSTDVKSYGKKEYWNLVDYLNVISVLENQSYFYFTSDKSQILELFKWLSANGFKNRPFDGAKSEILPMKVNYSSGYNDIMIYKNENTKTKKSAETVH